jgi:hypothetical protein
MAGDHAATRVCRQLRADNCLTAWKAQNPVLTRSLGWRIVDSNPARQATSDSRFDQIGCKEGERNRQFDLADAAVFARGDLPDISDDAGGNFIEPSPTTVDGCD